MGFHLMKFQDPSMKGSKDVGGGGEVFKYDGRSDEHTSQK